MGFFTTNAVVSMLKADHKKVSGLFKAFKRAERKEKANIAKTTIEELEVHAELEEKLIYPTIRREIEMDETMNEAVEEHHLVHMLIRELKKLKTANEQFAAKFNVLEELVMHHVDEEEGEILPAAEKSDVDWDTLEAKVMKRKEQLISKLRSRTLAGQGLCSA
jgi:hemerythrin-like domain-containing protein